MKSITRRRLLWSVPFATAAVTGGGFWAMLSGLKSGKFDPHEINTPLLNRPIPEFHLDVQPPGLVFDPIILRQINKPILLNFFASWCIPCLLEMENLQKLSSQIDIWGIAYKDKPENAENFLQRNGNPYRYLGNDLKGSAGIEWGISGVPESFLIMSGGMIRWHYPNPLGEAAIHQIHSLLRKS